MSLQQILKQARVKRGNNTERQAAKQNRLINGKYWGYNEPDIPEGQLNDQQYGKLLSWYHNMVEIDEAIEYLKTYLTSIKDKRATLIDAVPRQRIVRTACWQARLMQRGALLSDASKAHFERRLADMISYTNESDDDGEEAVAPRPQRNVQDYIREKNSDIMGELEGQLDDGTLNIEQFLVTYEVNGIAAKRINERFTARLAEIGAALDKSCPQITEAYSCYSKKQLKELYATYQSIVDATDRRISNIKKQRKPRTKKAPSVDKKLKFIEGNYCKHSNEYNVSSVNPAKIIGAEELWCFNTKYKILTVFRGASLDVKRRYIVGFDKKQSMSKKVGRKTADVIDDVIKGTKPRLRKLMDSINTDCCKLQEMVGEHVVFLRVI